MPPQNMHAPGASRGFTLIELLTVIAIIGVLAGIMIPVVSRVRLTAAKATTTSNLRQIGTAIQLYLDDNQDFLPGPFLSGQYNTYNNRDVRTLGYRLWSYFGLTEPETADKIVSVIENPAATRQRRGTPCPPFVVCTRVIDNAGDTPRELNGVNPWGYPTSAADPPNRITKASSIPNRSQTWAMQDVDAEHPLGAGGGGWKDNIPEKPVFGNVRMTLYFDWHVGPQKVEETRTP